MLRQEINLYKAHEIGGPASQFLTWNKFKLCLYIFIATLSLFYLYTYSIHYNLSKNNSVLQAQVTQLENEFNQLKESYPQLLFKKSLNETVSNMKMDLQNQHNVLKDMTGGNNFSDNLIKFSRLIVSDVWLTKVNLTNNENKMLISGESKSINSIQVFANNIQNDNDFKGYSVNVDSIQEPEKSEKKSNILFTISLQKLTS